MFLISYLSTTQVNQYEVYEVLKAERTFVYAGKTVQRVQDRLTLKMGDKTVEITLVEWNNAAKRVTGKLAAGDKLTIQGEVNSGSVVDRSRLMN